MELIISGPPHSGKTAAALEIALAVQGGILEMLKFAGRDDVVFVGTVAVASQLVSLGKRLGLDVENVYFLTVDGSEGSMIRAIDRCKEIKPALVVFDGVPRNQFPLAAIDSEGAPDVYALRIAAQTEGWTLVLCCPTPDRDE